jgi:outer membrane protein assembly factor BamB
MPGPIPDLFTWATNPGAEVVEPLSSLKAQGYRGLVDVPPADEFNWLVQRLAELATYVYGAGTLDTLDKAAQNLPVGYTCIVDEHDLDQQPLAQMTWTGLVGMMSVAVAGDGVVYLRSVAGALEAKKLSRDLTTELLTYNFGGVIPTVAGARIVTDGALVLVCNGFVLYAFDFSTGALLWTYNHGATIRDACLAGDRAFLVGDASGPFSARCILIANGLQAWRYIHGGDLFSCCTDGLRLYVSGDVSALPSLATTRAIVAQDGTDAFNDGGNGIDATGTAWDYAGNPSTMGGWLQTDGRHLYEITDSGGGYIVAMRETARGTAPLVTDNIVGSTVAMLALDQDFVYYFGDTVGHVICYDKDDLHAKQRTIQAAMAAGTGFVSDGCALFMAGPGGIVRYYRGNRARLWRRIDPAATRYTPYHWLLVPDEG